MIYNERKIVCNYQVEGLISAIKVDDTDLKVVEEYVYIGQLNDQSG